MTEKTRLRIDRRTEFPALYEYGVTQAQAQEAEESALAEIKAASKAGKLITFAGNQSLVPHLKPRKSLQSADGRKPQAASRRKRTRLTAGQIHAELDRLCESAPAQDAQAALRDLRQ